MPGPKRSHECERGTHCRGTHECVRHERCYHTTLDFEPGISVVVVTLNEGEQLRLTVENLKATLPADGEILVVDDGSTDGSADFLETAESPVRLLRSGQANLSKARNFGAHHARGDVLVFADAHIRVSPEWPRAITGVLANPEVGAVGPTVSALGEPECVGYGQFFTGPDLEIDWCDLKQDQPYPVCMLGGCFLAMRAATFREAGGFDEGMIRWGSEDTELCIRLWLSGREVWIAPSVDVAHLFREEFPYQVDWTQVLHNKLRLAFLHFSHARIARVVDALRDQDDFDAALARAVDGDYAARRCRFAASRQRDDDWLFEKFNLQW